MKPVFVVLSSLLLGAGLIPAAPVPYHLKICIVNGCKLGSMGNPITVVYNGPEILLRCKPSIKEFNADPAKFLTGTNPA